MLRLLIVSKPTRNGGQPCIPFRQKEMNKILRQGSLGEEKGKLRRLWQNLSPHEMKPSSKVKRLLKNKKCRGQKEKELSRTASKCLTSL